MSKAGILKILEAKFDDAFADIFFKLRNNLKDYLIDYADKVGFVESYLEGHPATSAVVMETKRITASQLAEFLKLSLIHI